MRVRARARARARARVRGGNPSPSPSPNLVRLHVGEIGVVQLESVLELLHLCRNRRAWHREI